RRQRDLDRRRARLSELVADAEAAAIDATLSSAARRFDLVRREWRDVQAGLAIDPSLDARYAAAEAQLTARETAAREEDARGRREGLARLSQLVARVEALAARPELSLKAGERALRDTRAALADLPPLPTKRDHDE